MLRPMLLMGILLLTAQPSFSAQPRVSTEQSRQERIALQQQEARNDLDALALLENLCKTHGANEPACRAVSELDQDNAWIVLYQACQSLPFVAHPSCEAYRQRGGGTLVFDLKTNRWRAEWEQRAYPLEFDVTGAPTLRLKPKDAKPLKIRIDEISPLTYSVSPGVPKEEDLTVIAGLKSFLTLAGTGIQGLVQTVATATLAAVERTSALSDVQLDTQLSVTSTTLASERTSTEPNCSVTLPKVGVPAEQVTKRLDQLVNVGTAMRSIESQLDTVAQRRAAFIREVQKAEDGKAVRASDLVRPDINDLTKAYDVFAESIKSFGERTAELASCQPLLAAYGTLLGAPPSPALVKDFAGRVAAVPGCTSDSVKALRTSIRDNAEALARSGSTCTAEQLKPILETHRDAMKPLVERLMNAKQVEEKVWAAIDKVGAGRNEVIAGAEALSRQVDRGHRHSWNNQLIRSLVVSRQNPELPWNKVQAHEIVIKADSPYQKEFTLAHGAEEKRAYKLESATGQILGYGVGLIYTPLQEFAYGAVSVPGTDTKVVTKVSQETRAGDLAAFLSYRFMEHQPRTAPVRPTFDLGVGLTSDRPAFFVGLGLEVFRAARISVGWTAQRLSMLDETQTPEGTVVASPDDIRTVKRFDTSRYYVAFTFALDSLSLFNKPQ
jgi:hypothetical protein